MATGFVYVVSDVGTTGERGELPAHLRELVEDVRGEGRRCRSPSASESAAPRRRPRSAEVADGVIIGSRLVRIGRRRRDADEAVAAVTAFLAETRDALAAGSVSRVL